MGEYVFNYCIILDNTNTKEVLITFYQIIYP